MTKNFIKKLFHNRYYAGLKYRNLSWFIDGFFPNKYCYISRSGRYGQALEWNKYFCNKDAYECLIKGLDANSIAIIERYNRVVKIIIDNYDLCIPKSLLSFSDNINSTMLKTNIDNYTNKIYGLKNKLPEVFFYKHGINEIPGIKDYSHGKDVIDCGAFIGDSALMLQKELDVRKVFSLEPDPQIFKELNEVIEKNHKKNKIVPINLGAGSKKSEMLFNPSGKGISSICESGCTKIKIDKLDNIVKENNINPGVIKWDIEGAEYDSIIGAEETIKKYKPILLISIYHTPRDFFEIKPLIESYALGYKFKIVHCQEGNSPAEIMLLCYI